MADDSFLEGFTMEVSRKPVGGVVEKDIPAVLAEALARDVPKALKDPENFEVQLKGKDLAAVKTIVLYARAWGARQNPKLRIVKIPNTQNMPDTIARLSVALDEEVPVENRPGRRPGTPNSK